MGKGQGLPAESLHGHLHGYAGHLVFAELIVQPADGKRSGELYPGSSGRPYNTDIQTLRSGQLADRYRSYNRLFGQGISSIDPGPALRITRDDTDGIVDDDGHIPAGVLPAVFALRCRHRLGKEGNGQAFCDRCRDPAVFGRLDLRLPDL